MKPLLTVILLTMLGKFSFSQQGFTFTHITTEDGTGLGSNLVTSIYQDKTGYIWVGTANGLQRFDGSKFIDVNTAKQGSDHLEHSRISQIIPADSGRLVLAMFNLREFGLFDPSTFSYKRIPLKPFGKILPAAEYRVWKDSKGEIYLNISNYGILHYDKRDNSFIDDLPFPFPKNWKVKTLGVHENVQKKQYWFACDSGLCIYDTRSRQMWSRYYNPAHLAILDNQKVQNGISQVYTDRQQRIWIFSVPGWGDGSQYKFCFDSTGTNFLAKDTIGLNHGVKGSTEYKYFYETSQGELWIYGFNILLNYDKYKGSFFNYSSESENQSITLDYESVFQVMEDKEHNIWLSTNEGIYYAATGTASSNILNAKFNDSNGPTSINDIMEGSDGQIWFASWRAGVSTTDKFLNKSNNDVYRQPAPASWSAKLKESTRQTVSLWQQRVTKNIWIGCNSGVLLIHNAEKKTTEYLHPPECDNSVIRFITEDKQGQMWLATQAGRLIKFSNNRFSVVQEFNTIIYKLFIDKQGWMWIATRESGLYALDPATGKVLQHYVANGGKNSLYSNTGTDIEQLQNGLIVFGGGALHFIDKKTGSVSIFKYEDGLPSNTVVRLRLDEQGFLWIITSNGLCRYNPNNNRITPYGKKDGVFLAEQTISADERAFGNIIFAGSNSVLMFNPAIFATAEVPSDVTITDFKIANDYLLVDSLFALPKVKLPFDKNSLSIYFASLSYNQRDKLTYYYKLEGIDNDWIKADRSYFANYSSLPPGQYVFRIYAETIEGKRSPKITELTILIQPPFYKTLWFMSCIFFVIALLIYAAHDIRVSRLMAVEALRNRVARDLHDDMGSTLSTINILSTMAKNKLNVDNIKTSEYLNKISENSQRMMEVMDDIVWSIKPSNDSMQKITARMREFATNALETKDIDFEFKVDEELYDVKLNMEARRDFFLVFKEAVNNAAKYSDASKVTMQVTLQNRRMIMIVKDDGQGFDLAEADGNGLGNMQKRADNLNGVLTIQSKKGEGTTVKLVLQVL